MQSVLTAFSRFVYVVGRSRMLRGRYALSPLLAGIVAALLVGLGGARWAQAQEGADTEARPEASRESEPAREETEPERKLPPPEGAKKLSPEYDVWIDPKEGVVLVDGVISLREGMLEMFACTRNTKEHESIVSANTKAFLVHAGLLSLGAEVGTPVVFVPEYKAPTGTEIEITVLWHDSRGKERKARAQEWVQNVKTKKEMAYPFVFAGSRFWNDPETGKQYYQAEGGDFICVSNFSTAMLDIPIPSSPSNEELMFQVYTEKVPQLGTPVRLILRPKLEKNEDAKSSDQQQPAEKGEGKGADPPKQEAKSR